MNEAIKYLVINIYDKNKRPNAGRVAIILTASANPRSDRGLTKLLRKKDITTLTVALGPGVNMQQIIDITKVSPDNRAYVLSSTRELNDHLLELTDYLCTLGMEPEVPKPATTTLAPGLKPKPTPPAGVSPKTTASSFPTKDVTFIVEGSDSVGEANFNKTLVFLENVISQLTEKEEVIRITIIQYSVTVTMEISRWELRQHRGLLLQRLREIRWRGGSKTNTGAAVTNVEKLTTDQPKPKPPQLVFLITKNPPTDTVTRQYNSTVNIYPIGVGPKVQEVDLFPFSTPRQPLMVSGYDELMVLVNRVVNITLTTVTPRSPTLPPLKVPKLSKPPPSGEQLSFHLFSWHTATILYLFENSLHSAV